MEDKKSKQMKVKTPASDAAHKLSAARKKAAEDKKREEIYNNRDKVWYVPCKHCGGIALWFAHKPVGMMGPSDWYSSYKPLGVPWPISDLHCQVCERRVPVMKYTSGYRVYSRRIAEMPMAAFEALQAEDFELYESLMEPKRSTRAAEKRISERQYIPQMLKDPGKEKQDG